MTVTGAFFCGAPDGVIFFGCVLSIISILRVLLLSLQGAVV